VFIGKEPHVQVMPIELCDTCGEDGKLSEEAAKRVFQQLNRILG
jgi:hypothetical protein